MRGASSRSAQAQHEAAHCVHKAVGALFLGHVAAALKLHKLQEGGGGALFVVCVCQVVVWGLGWGVGGGALHQGH
jgi:hypothetical protein